MKKIFKAVGCLFIILIVLFFVKTFLSITADWDGWVSNVLSVLSALLTGWYTWIWLSGGKVGIGASILSGALIMGGIGFTLGFFGPILFIQNTQQATFVSIFIASPLGLFLGALGGYLLASRRGNSVS